MNELEWSVCPDPRPMLEYLRGKASQRKLRLFAAADCRRVWHLLTDERTRQAIETVERHADEVATDADRIAAARAAHAAKDAAGHAHPGSLAYYAGRMAYYAVCCDDSYAAAQNAIYGGDRTGEPESGTTLEHSQFLRDVFGNPFRPVSLSPSWLAWNDGVVHKLAQRIYDDRAFDRLPILADALEEAGCADREILDHCRSGGEHVRGCWVVDLLLGKS